MKNFAQRIYVVVNSRGNHYASTAADTPKACIERAEYALDDLWENLHADGYRVAVCSLTIQRVMDDEEIQR